MFQMRPRTGGGGGPVPQAPPPTASPRRRVAESVILQGWAGDPSRRAAPLPGLTAEAEPGSARLGLGWRFRAWLTSFGPSGLHRRTLFAPGLCSCGARRDGRVLQSQWFAPTMYHIFMKTISGNLKQGSQTSASGWDFLTNHAHVLVCVAHDSGIRLRGIPSKPRAGGSGSLDWPPHEPLGPDGDRADLARRARLRHLLAAAERADRLPRHPDQRGDRQPDRGPAPPPRVGGPRQGHLDLHQLPGRLGLCRTGDLRHDAVHQARRADDLRRRRR